MASSTASTVSPAVSPSSTEGYGKTVNPGPSQFTQTIQAFATNFGPQLPWVLLGPDTGHQRQPIG